MSMTNRTGSKFLSYFTFPLGQRPPEEGYLACHRQGSADPGGLSKMEHPLLQEMGGPAPLEQEDGRGPAGGGLPT
ncbi:hypothetical protein NDU88_006044 [Pleurodeles waltl]|uniref:Uncharacterized protein n=1 Tax=Pleurodeles waltl TaxID=8319 RepID=A0AAV7PPJ3_PLEWA|nr:hypothetical protein NDU88_006044 [Pleurodeles waltl]